MNEFERFCFGSLKNRFPKPEWLVFSQVKTNTGVSANFGGERYIDFFIMNMYPSQDYVCKSIEVKKTFADFKSDIENPMKQVSANFYSDEFYYLLDKKMYEKNRNKIWTMISENNYKGGLFLIDANGNIPKVEKRSFTNRKNPFSFGFIASLVRNKQKD